MYGRHADDLIDWAVTSFGRATPINRASADVLGASAYIHLKTASWLMMSSYRWQHEWVYDNPLETQARRLTASPTHRIKNSVWWMGKALRLGTSFDWSSARYLDAANLRQQEAQARMNLGFGYRLSPSSPITLNLNIINVLNTQQHLLHLMPGSHEVQAPLQDRWGQVLPGRQIRVGFSMRQQR
jgi:outer membrane receptor protein involved in Fe transport